MYLDHLLFNTLNITAMSALPSHSTCSIIAAAGPLDTNFDVNQCFPSTKHNTEMLQFLIGPVAVGPCSLVVDLPAGLHVNQSGAAQIEVFGIDGNAPGAQVGTVGPFPVQDGVLSQDVHTTINSFQCKDVLTFEFAIADGRDGSVEFFMGEDAGFFIQVGDC